MADIRWNYDTSSALAFGELVGIGSDLLPLVASDVATQAFTYSFAYRLWRHTGQLTASIGYDIGYDTLGYFADVSSIWYGRFLDPKAVQLHYLRPLLPSSLEVINGRTY